MNLTYILDSGTSFKETKYHWKCHLYVIMYVEKKKTEDFMPFGEKVQKELHCKGIFHAKKK